jgi:amino acid transporter
MIVVTTVVCLMGARVRSIVNNIGVSVELVGSVVLIVLFLFHSHRGPGVVFHTNGTAKGYGDGYLGPLLVCLLLGTIVMWGFDTASSIGEETINPRKTSPRAVVRALVASGVFGALLLLTAAMAVKNSHDPSIASGGLAYIIQQVFGKTGGDIMLVCAAVAVFVCGLANQVGAVNMMFAMARDNGLPGASRLSHVAERAKTPIVPAILVAAVAIAILTFNAKSPSIFLVVSGTTVIFALFSYLLIAMSFVMVRLRGEWELPEKGYFSLGKLGLPVSIGAAIWATFAIIDIAWPRNLIYNPTAPFHWYLKWGGILFPAICLGLSWGVYHFRQRARIGILPEHAAQPSAVAVSARITGEQRLAEPVA